FHDGANSLINARLKGDHAPLVLNMHSFTPQMNGFRRPWHSGLLWNKDDRIAKTLKERLDNRGFNVGDNEPYTGQELNYTMNTHGTRHGFPHVNIEIRQDEIDHAAGVEKWSTLLAEEIKAIRALPEMSYIKHY
ncbi:MAG: N-formylglutamate amidohydrolase, partial [Kordiimonadaceae bacterium]|nr:N-formylglutamate amidohydrolase [Kordiimonadaceae bacterium]